MSGINKRRQFFLVHLTVLYLSMRGRKNFLMMERYGAYSEQTYRQHFSKPHDFRIFNLELVKQHCGKELLWAFDPSYITKSGKHTPGVGYFWSGCAQSMKWGLELGALGLLDIENQTAMHYYAQRTTFVKGEDSLRAYYATLITEQASEMLKTSKNIAFDAFFSKKQFVDSICKAGFTLISRLQHNIYMRYAFIGKQKGGRGAPKKFDGQIDVKNLSMEHFKEIKRDKEEVVYEGLAHVRSLKRWCKVVIAHTLKEDGQIKSALIYFSTALEMSGFKVLQYYRNRYQIEFLFRDAKGHLGLEDCQSRKGEALDFHFNTVLTTLNLAKAHHWLSIPKDQRPPFSMADIKTQYINELLLDRLICIYGKCPSVEKNNPEIQKLYQLGRIAA
jgi:hypothetical protein